MHVRILALTHNNASGALDGLSGARSSRLDRRSGTRAGAGSRLGSLGGTGCGRLGRLGRARLGGLCGLLSALLAGLGGSLGLLGELLSALLDGIGGLGEDTGGLVGAVLLDELQQVLDGAGAGVVNGSVLLASGEELDGGEALDLIGNVVGGGVNLGDGHELGELRRGESLAKLLVLGSKSLAVTAPGSVELNENILLVVDDDLLVVLGDDGGDGAVVLLGNGLRLDGRLNLASEEVLDEGANLLSVDLVVLVVGELLVLVGALDSESGPLAGLQVEVAGVLTESTGVNGSEVDGTLVLDSKRLQLLSELLTLLGCLGEDVGEGNASGHVASVCLGANLADEGSGSNGSEGLDRLSIELLGEDILAVVERLVEDETRLLNTLSLGESGIICGTKKVVVAEAAGDRVEGLVGGLVVGGEVSNEDDLVGGLELLECVLGDLGDGGQTLLGHVRDQRVGLALTAVGRDVVEATEDLQGGVALNAVLLAEIRLLCAINLDELDVLLLQCGGSGLVLGSERLAVTAPWCEDCIDVSRALETTKADEKARYLHSARTRSLSWTNSLKSSVFSWTTSEVAATTAAKKAAQMVEHFIVAVVNVQLGIWGVLEVCSQKTSAAMEWKGRAEAGTRVYNCSGACGGSSRKTTGVYFSQPSAERQSRVHRNAKCTSGPLSPPLYWTPWSSCIHSLPILYLRPACPGCRAFARCFTSARMMFHLSSGQIRLELPLK